VAPADLRLAGGAVLLPGVGLAPVDVLVAGGRVAGLVERGSDAPAAEVVDVAGLAVLPGAIDAHVHLAQNLTVPTEPIDVEPETAAAAAGGVTTILTYLMTPTPYEQVVPAVTALMAETAAVDFGFHFCIVTEEQKDAVPMYAEELGVSSFKFFMNFRGDEGAYLGLPGNDDGFLYELLENAAACGAMVNPHPENIEIVWRLRGAEHPPDAPPLEVWNATRPAHVEAEAIQRAAFLARTAGASLYAVHVSSAGALEIAARERAAYPGMFIETCPHYLTHDTGSDAGLLGKVNPPLRNAADREALWRGLEAGLIDVVGSDHVPRMKAAKGPDVWKASAGFPGLETLVPVLLSEGCVRRGLPLERVVDLFTCNPARIFGLYPRKGVIAVGSDADFAIVDFGRTQTVDGDALRSRAGYSIYDGRQLDCAVVHTLVRGRFALRDGVLTGETRGAFVPRRASGRAAAVIESERQAAAR